MNKELNYNYNNLETGQSHKSYRKLCEVLGAKVTTGASKQAQFKEWECYFSYKKQGNSFVITEIYDAPKERVYNYSGGNNKVKYIDGIEKLILDLLVQCDNDEKTLFLSKNKLLRELNMINKRYGNSKFKRNRLSKELEVPLDEINDFYIASDSMLQRNLESALNNLRNKAIVLWKTSTTVAYVNHDYKMNADYKPKSVKTFIVDSYGDESNDFKVDEVTTKYTHVKADEYVEYEILKAEGLFLDEMKYKSIQEVIINNDTSKFYTKVKDYLFEHFNIINYYDSYEITFNKDRAEVEQLDIETDALLNESERVIVKNKLNSDVVIQLKNNTLNRSVSAENKTEDVKYKEKYQIRMRNNYVDNGNKLIDALVKSE